MIPFTAILPKEMNRFRSSCCSICAQKHEYEANAFASHLIIDDDDLIDLMKQDYDVVQLSSAMGTNINLMLIKLNELNRMGWKLNLPYVPRSDFLKNVRPEGRMRMKDSN